MTDARNQLIERLAQDLQPVRTRALPVYVGLLWWALSWAFVASIALLIEPPRSGALAQAATHSQFLLESLLGLVAAAVVAVFAFSDSIPANARRAVLPVGLVLAAAWVLAYVIGLDYPALEPSMAGKRPHCFLETFIYSVPPTLAGIYLCRRYYVLAPLRTTALISMAAAMLPALLMQFACMYDPAHILSRHILPISLVVAAATLTHWLINRWPRGRGNRPIS